jgi:uncharacterized protein
MPLDSSATAPRTDVVVVQPTPFCNINCRYCYLPDRSNKATISLDTVETLFQKVFSSGWLGDELTVIWHAGEPLVMAVDFYRRAFGLIESLRPVNLRLRHSIQTNGMLIRKEWCELFRQWQVGVGVSIDGPRRFHDANRMSRTGRGTFDKTIAGIRLLRQQEVPFHVISVLTRESMAAPEEMLEFYVSEGITDVCFNIEESEGSHVSSLLAQTDAQASFSGFLEKFWHLSRADGRIGFIREVDGMLPRVFRGEEAPLRNAQVEPFGMLNVDCRGDVSSFSPELLGLKSAHYNNFIIGNIKSDSLEDMRLSPAMQSMARDIAEGVKSCRASCHYFSVCGGGAPVNKWSEAGSFAGTRTGFCKLTQQVPIDLILASLRRLRGNGRRELEEILTRARDCGERSSQRWPVPMASSGESAVSPRRGAQLSEHDRGVQQPAG